MKNENDELWNEAGPMWSETREGSQDGSQKAVQDSRLAVGFDVSYGADADGVCDLVIKLTDERGEQHLHVPRPSLAALCDLTRRLHELGGFMDRIETGVVVYSPNWEPTN